MEVDSEESSCGFCLTDCHQEQLWKCDRCTWAGHPSCWMSLRQEVWNGNNSIIHSNGSEPISPWNLPTGKCPQCREQIAWTSFLENKRKSTNLESFQGLSSCWICHNEIDDTILDKSTWKCTGSGKHPQIQAHWECLWKWSGNGTCIPECVLCGKTPYKWEKQFCSMIKWRKAVSKMSLEIPHSNFYQLFFNMSQFGEATRDEYKFILAEYIKFLKKGIGKHPEKWWQTMYFTAKFIYEQINKVIVSLFAVPEAWGKDELILKSRKYLIELVDTLRKANESIISEYPSLKGMNKVYRELSNRVSPPLPGEFFPIKWLQLTKSS